MGYILCSICLMLYKHTYIITRYVDYSMVWCGIVCNSIVQSDPDSQEESQATSVGNDSSAKPAKRKGIFGRPVQQTTNTKTTTLHIIKLQLIANHNKRQIVTLQLVTLQ